MTTSFAKVQIMGYLGADPKLQTTNEGKKLLALSIATASPTGKAPLWHNVVLWDKAAENAATFLKKGSKILVNGGLVYSKYTDKDGIERKSTQVNCNEIYYLSLDNNQEKQHESQQVSQAEASDKKVLNDSDNEKISNEEDIPF